MNEKRFSKGDIVYNPDSVKNNDFEYIVIRMIDSEEMVLLLKAYTTPHEACDHVVNEQHEYWIDYRFFIRLPVKYLAKKQISVIVDDLKLPSYRNNGRIKKSKKKRNRRKLCCTNVFDNSSNYVWRSPYVFVYLGGAVSPR